MSEYHQITLDEWTKWREEIRQKLQEATGNFVYIGYRLKQIRDSGMYDGKEDFFEWAEEEYGLSKSTVSRFIAINEKFANPDNRLELKTEYQSLGSSKLSEMLTLPDKECELITEQTTVKEIRELKSMDKAEPEEEPQGAEGDYTPLERCVIDYFKDKLDLLRQVSKLDTDKEIAEAMVPSGYATHKKGAVFLFMYDYNSGIKYKLVGNPAPQGMTWAEFVDVIDRVVFDQGTDIEDVIEKLYGEKKAKRAENAQEVVENAPEVVENTQKEAESVQEVEKVPEAAQKQATNDGTDERSIVTLYDDTLKLIDKMRFAFEARKWEQALDSLDPIRWKIQSMISKDQAVVDNALDRLMEE